MKNSLNSSVVEDRIINEFIVKSVTNELAKPLFKHFIDFISRYKRMFGEKFRFEAEPCNMEVESLLKEQIININVKICYYRGESTGQGYISGHVEFLKKAKEKFDRDYKLEGTYIHTLGNTKLNFKGLSPINNEFDLLYLLKPLCKGLSVNHIRIFRVILSKVCKTRNPQTIVEFMDIMKKDFDIDLHTAVFDEKRRQDKFLNDDTSDDHDPYYKTLKTIN